jgi:hypothetical protein
VSQSSIDEPPAPFTAWFKLAAPMNESRPGLPLIAREANLDGARA